MISYRIGFSECEHGRASNSQHARKRLSNESFRACQGLISGIFGPEKPFQNFCSGLSLPAIIMLGLGMVADANHHTRA
jgi:hypothetical protein